MPNRIKEILESLGQTPRELSEKANIGNTTIYKVMNGHQVPRIDMAYKISKALGKKIDEVFPEN